MTSHWHWNLKKKAMTGSLKVNDMNTESLLQVAEKKLDMTTGGLREFREKNLASFRENGLTEVVLDSYKFTNLKTFLEGLHYAPKNFEGDLPEFKADIPTITFVDGEFTKSDSLPGGIKIKKVSEHFSDIKDVLKTNNALSSLHHGLLCEGLLIEVKDELTMPVRILNLLTKASISAPTHFIIAHPHSKMTLLEETRGVNADHLNIGETYITAHPGSQIEHIYVDHDAPEGINHHSVFAEVEKDATVKSFIFHTSGKLNRKNLEMNLNAPGSNGESYALFLTHGKEQSDINTIINHKAPDTTSTQLAKGILDGDSKGIFTGKIHIFPKAQRVASSQLNRNLLLSKKAQVHSQPQLEIFADDVKCSHGSTTGQLSPDEVFYFQARGIPADKARTLLAHGFGMEVVQKISNPVARDYVSGIIMENLAVKFSLGGQL